MAWCKTHENGSDTHLSIEQTSPDPGKALKAYKRVCVTQYKSHELPLHHSLIIDVDNGAFQVVQFKGCP